MFESRVRRFIPRLKAWAFSPIICKPKNTVSVYSEIEEDEVTKKLREIMRAQEEARMAEDFEDYLKRVQ